MYNLFFKYFLLKEFESVPHHNVTHSTSKKQEFQTTINLKTNNTANSSSVFSHLRFSQLDAYLPTPGDNPADQTDNYIDEMQVWRSAFSHRCLARLLDSRLRNRPN